MYLLFMFILWFLIYLLKEKLKELKRRIGDRFDEQKVSLRKIISEICSALFDGFKKIWN